MRPVLFCKISPGLSALVVVSFFQLLFVGSAWAALQLPGVFSDGMVLQRDQPLPVWGKAEPGAVVTVELGSQRVEGKAGADGRWQVQLPPYPANSQPGKLRVQAGGETLEFSNVLIGEVWLCSGQSNMDWTVGKCLDGDLERLTGANPQIRLLRLDRVKNIEPQFTNAARWQEATPDSIAKFSAVGWAFGSTLQPALGVPVGLLDASWGGTPAIAWTRPSAFVKHPQLQAKDKQWNEKMPLYAEELAAWEKADAEYRKKHNLPADLRLYPAEHPEAPPKPSHDPESPNRPGVLANGMLAAIAPYALRGAIWYQGESDAGWEPKDYDERLAVMVNDWREWWGNPQMAFGVVQLASFMAPQTEPSDEPWPNLRESQRQFVLADPHAGLAVALDAGEANDIHPRNKQVIGRRLARWALADVYGLLQLRGGPEPLKAFFSDKVTIAFAQVGSGLAVWQGGDLGGFTLAGEDGVFHTAKARIEGKDKVVVESAEVAKPRAVRYAWQNNPVTANLMNQERLPAAAFELSADAPSTNAQP